MRNASKSWQCRAMRRIPYARSQSVTLVSTYLPCLVILLCVYVLLAAPSMFGRSLGEQITADGRQIPVIVSKCIEAVEAQGESLALYIVLAS